MRTIHTPLAALVVVQTPFVSSANSSASKRAGFFVGVGHFSPHFLLPFFGFAGAASCSAGCAGATSCSGVGLAVGFAAGFAAGLAAGFGYSRIASQASRPAASSVLRLISDPFS